jgi:hypothetical protein
MENLYQSLVSSLLPKEINQYFAMVSIIEQPHGVELRMEEHAELIPPELSEKPSVVLDGFCNPLELLHYSIKGKPLYLRIYRRRWKESGSSKHYSNQYDLHPEGVKATHEFASFLKGEVRCTADEYVCFLLDTKS